MKKNYISPKLMVENVEMVKTLCLTVSDSSADGSKVLTKERPAVDFSKEDNDFQF